MSGVSFSMFEGERVRAEWELGEERVKAGRGEWELGEGRERIWRFED